MAETLNLTTPITKPSTSALRFGSVFLQKEPTPELILTVIDNNNQGIVVKASDTMTTTDILADLKQLNKLNYTATSLEKRLMNTWLPLRRPDLTGTVTGTPD
jgi:hypothetical protein